MTTDTCRLEVGGIEVDVVWKDIKNLHVGVYPPNGRVRVASPLGLDAEAVRLALVSRLGWIRKQKRGFDEQVRQSQREMVSGESHYYQGRRYLLDVREVDSKPCVRISNNTTLQLDVRHGMNRDQREAVLQKWYRAQLREQIPPLLKKRLPRVGVEISDIRIKRMKTKWGTCNSEAARIWLNLELIKKPPQCLEYILVHELVHLHQRHHNDRFKAWMDRLLPQWRNDRDKLNRAPLSHEGWDY